MVEDTITIWELRGILSEEVANLIGKILPLTREIRAMPYNKTDGTGALIINKMLKELWKIAVFEPFNQGLNSRFTGLDVGVFVRDIVITKIIEAVYNRQTKNFKFDQNNLLSDISNILSLNKVDGDMSILEQRIMVINGTLREGYKDFSSECTKSNDQNITGDYSGFGLTSQGFKDPLEAFSEEIYQRCVATIFAHQLYAVATYVRSGFFYLDLINTYRAVDKNIIKSGLVKIIEEELNYYPDANDLPLKNEPFYRKMMENFFEHLALLKEHSKDPNYLFNVIFAFHTVNIAYKEAAEKELTFNNGGTLTAEGYFYRIMGKYLAQQDEMGDTYTNKIKLLLLSKKRSSSNLEDLSVIDEALTTMGRLFPVPIDLPQISSIFGDDSEPTQEGVVDRSTKLIYFPKR